mgnify:CR=1 FL=1|tara:strand:- start:642 stop:1031 length:390 start_codon:yes stop_codon:yes gene_type:complete
MPETIDSLEFTLTDVTPFVWLPLPYFFLHTIKAREEAGGLMTMGKLRILDGLSGGDEAVVYDSTDVPWTASTEATSISDSWLGGVPITSNYSTGFTAAAIPTGAALLILTETAATGAWSVVVRLTISRG